VTEELLHLANAVAVFQQVRGEAVTQRVTVRRLREPGPADRALDRALDRLLVHVVTYE